MSMSKTLLAIYVALGVSAGAAAQTPDLGHPVDETDLAPWDLSVPPDGHNLPAGAGTAREGAKVFQNRCAACHGETGRENETGLAPLAGGIGSLSGPMPVKTVGSYWPYATTVFDYIRRAMPYDAPKSLNTSEIYAVTAYLLHINGIIAEDAVMNAETLPEVEMPNRDGFTPAWPSD